jgi:LPXTG-motif cell wall-anchored protein
MGTRSTARIAVSIVGSAVLVVGGGRAVLAVTSKPPLAVTPSSGTLTINRVGPAFDTESSTLHVCDFTVLATGFAPGETVSYAFTRYPALDTDNPLKRGTIATDAAGSGESAQVSILNDLYKPFVRNPDGPHVYGLFHVDCGDTDEGEATPAPTAAATATAAPLASNPGPTATSTPLPICKPKPTASPAATPAATPTATPTHKPCQPPPKSPPPSSPPPATDPPATDPPATDPPATQPPVTDPPVTESPSPVPVPTIVPSPDPTPNPTPAVVPTVPPLTDGGAGGGGVVLDPSAGGGGSGSLPRTGDDSSAWALWALGAIGSGAAALRLGRRRPPRHLR